eukprot:m.7509 g.7509  ORF g.7509 m.7509 type:complete len:122 (+) comp2955_c0_seq1:41-406(+)
MAASTGCLTAAAAALRPGCSAWARGLFFGHRRSLASTTQQQNDDGASIVKQAEHWFEQQAAASEATAAETNARNYKCLVENRALFQSIVEEYKGKGEVSIASIANRVGLQVPEASQPAGDR